MLPQNDRQGEYCMHHTKRNLIVNATVGYLSSDDAMRVFFVALTNHFHSHKASMVVVIYELALHDGNRMHIVGASSLGW